MTPDDAIQRLRGRGGAAPGLEMRSCGRLVLALLCGSCGIPGARADVLPIAPAACQAMEDKHVMTSESPVPCERLREVSFRFIDFGGGTRTGRVVVLDAVSGHVQAIFDELYARRFPLSKARPMQDYLGDDDASMEDDNTSGFNARPVAGGSGWSLHAFGAAIDLNPVENPFIEFTGDARTARVSPASSAKAYVNRLNRRPGKETRRGMAEDVVDVFADHGFLVWGGYWNVPIDYQHFEVGDERFATRLAQAGPADAQALFEERVDRYRSCMARHASTGSREDARAACVSATVR
jgi:hypothetical protein